MNTALHILLWPLAFLFNAITSFRNFLYDSKRIKSTKFDLPIICVGNLSTGGTGKTPHTNYLIELIKTEYNVGVLSRGYKRKTNGYIEVETNSTASQVGDEPLFYKWKHPDCKIAVCEDRVFGIAAMAQYEDENFVYLLDDAFQHRAIKAGLNIILTEYNQLYIDDYVLPQGNLRENASNAKRADIIIVSKCPPSLSKSEKLEIRGKLKPESYQFVFFSSMEYHALYSIFSNRIITNEKETTALIVTGIASPAAMVNELDSRFKKTYLRSFSDHYQFTQTDVESIIRTFQNLEENNKVLITTEKDATRLFHFKNLFIEANIDIFCLPIKVKFDSSEKLGFNKAIKHYLSITLPLPLENENEIII